MDTEKINAKKKQDAGTVHRHNMEPNGDVEMNKNAVTAEENISQNLKTAHSMSTLQTLKYYK